MGERRTQNGSMEGIDALLGKTKSCWRGSTLSATWFCCNLTVVTGKIGSCYFIFNPYRQVVTLFLILTGKLLLYFWYLQASCYLIFDTSKVNAGLQELNSAYVGACGRLDCRTDFFLSSHLDCKIWRKKRFLLVWIGISHFTLNHFRKKIIYDFEKRKKMHAIKLIQKLNDRLYANKTKQARQVSRMQWNSSFAV